MNKDLIITTVNYNTISKLSKDVQMKTKMVSVIGYPGAGKTTALTNFCKNNKNVYYVRVTASMNAKQFYMALIKEMGGNEQAKYSSLHDMINGISYRLNYDTEKNLLIIDESGKFSPKGLEYLHELRDNTMYSTGIILAGPDYFHENMSAWKNKNKIGVPELYRRISHWEYLDRPTKKEVRVFCEAYGVTDEEIILDIIKTASECFSAIVNAIENYLANRDNKGKKDE